MPSRPASAVNPHDGSPEPLGLYVHWPFCQSKCPYCDFNSHVVAEVDHDRWRRALCRELETFASRAGPGRSLGSIFFGGGTPSLMEAETVAAVIEIAQRLFRFNNDIEISLEANPTSTEAGRLNAFRAAGVNRISLGIQALDNDALAFLGRTHSAQEALGAIEIAQSCFENVSFDLMTARPEQSIESWMAELDRAVGVGTDHLSIYHLTIEPTTPFHALHARGAFTLPDGDTAADLYERTNEYLAALGLPAYEVSNHARPGKACRHNLNYWHYGDYIGVGPGAHGRISAADGVKWATRTHRAPSLWLERVERFGHAVVDDNNIRRSDIISEATLMGLRTVEGLPRHRWQALLEHQPEDLFADHALSDLRDEGLIELDEQGLRATTEGRLRLDLGDTSPAFKPEL